MCVLRIVDPSHIERESQVWLNTIGLVSDLTHFLPDGFRLVICTCYPKTGERLEHRIECFRCAICFHSLLQLVPFGIDDGPLKPATWVDRLEVCREDLVNAGPCFETAFHGFGRKTPTVS